MFEGRVLGSAKLGFSKDPIQPPSEDAAHTGFPGSHEANQKNSVDRKTSDRGGRWLKPPRWAWPCIRRFSRSLRHKLASCCKLLAATCRAGSEQLETEWFAILRCVC